MVMPLGQRDSDFREIPDIEREANYTQGRKLLEIVGILPFY